jgi:hypothetical protein
MNVGACPRCGSRKLRSSRRRDFSEHVLRFAGVEIFRCRRCSHRFTSPMFSLETLRFAHCPGCLGAASTTWSEPYLRVGWWNRFKAAIGANKLHCDKCRRNFASFRRAAAKPEPGRVPVS